MDFSVPEVRGNLKVAIVHLSSWDFAPSPPQLLSLHDSFSSPHTQFHLIGKRLNTLRKLRLYVAKGLETNVFWAFPQTLESVVGLLANHYSEITQPVSTAKSQASSSTRQFRISADGH